MVNKNKVYVVIYKKNRQVVRRLVLPKNDSFDVNNKSYIIDAENYYIFRNKACYTYLEDVPTPLTLKDIIVTDGKKELVPLEAVAMTADELNTFKRSKTAKEILDTIDNSMSENVLMFAILGVMVVGFGFLWFSFSNQVNELMLMMRDILEVFSGGGR